MEMQFYVLLSSLHSHLTTVQWQIALAATAYNPSQENTPYVLPVAALGKYII